MKRASFAALCTLLLATAAHAEDAPRYAPAPSWVKPTAIPKPGPETEVSFQTLLLDRQERLKPAGDAYYVESAQLIQTPEGLSDAATVSMGWAPDIETLVVHKIAIIRAGKTIDVLAGGRKLDILRREASLERAALDGRLTATIQPEGLEVGDVLDIAYTIERRDPVLAGNINSTIGGVTATAVKSHVSQSWPKTVAMHWQASSDLPKPRTHTIDGMTEIAWDMDSPKPAEVLPGVPTRFARIGMLETSSFADWQSVSRLMAPIYATAATLKADTVLKGEAQKIAAASSDPATRASAALALVQTRIRYFYNGLGNGGYTPAAADLTWSRRFGDCKGKTVLLLALLKELGIEAVPALVSSGDFALDWRLSCRRMLGLTDQALADADAIAALDRKSASSAALRVNILIAAGRGDAAVKELDALVATSPTDQDMRLVRARTLVMLDRNAEAVVDFGKALAAGPSIEVYAGRSSARKAIDPTGALADADAAVALDAKSSWARIVRAQRLADAERYDAAVAEMTTAIAGGETPELLVSRADLYRKWKKPDLATIDLRRARTLAKDGQDHNTLCWWEATTSFSLETALSDCGAALALDPNQSSYIDSRGMALLQLGRNGDAIAAFDRALAISPFLPASLYARGIAKLRAGDRPGARADITAARNFAPGIAKSYIEYGIAVPTL